MPSVADLPAAGLETEEKEEGGSGLGLARAPDEEGNKDNEDEDEDEDDVDNDDDALLGERGSELMLRKSGTGASLLEMDPSSGDHRKADAALAAFVMHLSM